MSKISTMTALLLRRRAAEAAGDLPALLLAAREAARTVSAGQHARRRTGMGESFWQFRDYQTGDRPQDIDWRQSAKGDRLHIRQKEWQTAQTILFWCAGGPGMRWRSSDRYPAKREAALTLALSVASLMTEAGEQVGPLDAARRPARHDQGLEGLAEALLEADTAAMPGVTPPRRAQLVLAGDFLTPVPQIEAQLSGLAAFAAGGVLLQVLDPAELDLPYDGRLIFIDTNPGVAGAPDQYPVAQAAALSAAYRERLDAHRGAIADLCARHGWHYHLHRTDRTVRATLANIWSSLSATGGTA